MIEDAIEKFLLVPSDSENETSHNMISRSRTLELSSLRIQYVVRNA